MKVTTKSLNEFESMAGKAPTSSRPEALPAARLAQDALAPEIRVEHGALPQSLESREIRVTRPAGSGSI